MCNLMKTGEAVLEKKFKDFMILYLYIAQGQGQITMWVGEAAKILILTKRFYCFNHTLL